MQAITGPWPSFVRSLKASAFAPSGFANHLDWASARGRDFQCVGTILYHLCKPTAAHPGATQLETWLSADAPVPEKFRQDVEEAFAVYIALVRAFHTVFHEPTKLAPVEFVMVGVLVSKYGKKMSMKGLAEAVKGMRADVRRKHSDIRMNGKVTKTTLEYIRQVEVGVLKKGEKSAVEEMKATAGSVTGVKRKRKVVQSEDDGESEDSEARPPPSKPKPTPAAGKLLHTPNIYSLFLTFHSPKIYTETQVKARHKACHIQDPQAFHVLYPQTYALDPPCRNPAHHETPVQSNSPTTIKRSATHESTLSTASRALLAAYSCETRTISPPRPPRPHPRCQNCVLGVSRNSHGVF